MSSGCLSWKYPNYIYAYLKSILFCPHEFQVLALVSLTRNRRYMQKAEAALSKIQFTSQSDKKPTTLDTTFPAGLWWTLVLTECILQLLRSWSQTELFSSIDLLNIEFALEGGKHTPDMSLSKTSPQAEMIAIHNMFDIKELMDIECI